MPKLSKCACGCVCGRVYGHLCRHVCGHVCEDMCADMCANIDIATVSVPTHRTTRRVRRGECRANGLNASRAKCTPVPSLLEMPLPMGDNIGGLFGCKIGKHTPKGTWRGTGAPAKVCCIKTTNKAGVQEEHLRDNKHCAQIPWSVYTHQNHH